METLSPVACGTKMSHWGEPKTAGSLSAGKLAYFQKRKIA